jgi:hypothetical protein
MIRYYRQSEEMKRNANSIHETGGMRALVLSGLILGNATDGAAPGETIGQPRPSYTDVPQSRYVKKIRAYSNTHQHLRAEERAPRDKWVHLTMSEQGRS